MKNKIQIFILILITGSLFFTCEEEGTPEPDWDRFTHIICSLPNEYGRSEHTIPGTLRKKYLVENAEVRIFSNEQDFINDENPIKVVYTDTVGYYGYEHYDTSFIFLRAKYQNLTSKRYYSVEIPCNHTNMRNSNTYFIDFDDWGTESAHLILTIDPASLNIQVLQQGQPISGAEVQLYFSEEAYVQDVVAQEDRSELLATYGDPDYSFRGFPGCLEENFKKATDAEGNAFFPNLEPKQYWFKVTKDDLSNDNGTITTGEPLRNDTEITKSITVGIN